MKKICEYKGFLITDDYDHDTWSYCYEAMHKLSSGKKIEFSSDWFSADLKEDLLQKERQNALDAVKAQIDGFIQRSTTPELYPYQIYPAGFFYYNPYPIISDDSQKLCDYYKEKLQNTELSAIQIQIDNNTKWTDYYKDFAKTKEHTTSSNQRTEVIELRIYGDLETDCKHSFRIICRKYSKFRDYIEIQLKNEQDEAVADKIAQILGCYEAKEFARTIQKTH